MIQNILLTAITVVATIPSLYAADWTDSAFPVKDHSFGDVAVAAKTEFVFPVFNNLSGTMHIQSVRASCGCTTPTVLNEYINPGEEGAIKAKFNTDTFRGAKAATLTVVIDKPFYAEVRLKVKGYIRSDIVFHPGSLNFGSVNQGEKRALSAKVLYAGRSDWQIVDVRTNKPWMLPQLTETSRGGGNVNYELSVALREDAPAGFFQDELVVVTNDRAKPNVPLLVSGQVVSAISMSPQAISLGSVKSGESITAKLVLVGKQPFKIDAIEAEQWDIDFQPSDSMKKMHILQPKLTFVGDLAGPNKTSIVVKTSGDRSVQVKGLLTADIRDQ